MALIIKMLMVKNEAAFANAVEAFKKGRYYFFTSTITNEEAYLLQKMKEKFGYKLINNEAKALQTFLNNYSQISGKKLYGSDLEAVHTTNFIVSVGSALKTDNPNARYALNNSLTVSKGAGLYFHPVKDPIIKGLAKSIMTVTHAPLQEEVALYLVLDLFADKSKLPSDIVEYLASFHSEKTLLLKKLLKKKLLNL